jgi:hypothetical protein
MDTSGLTMKGTSNFLRITISGSYTETDSEGRFTMFLITVQSVFAKWEICRRYRHFQALHQELTSRLPNLKLPSLPGKKKSIFGSSLDPSIVEERKVSLEAYLRNLLQFSEVWANQTFIEFLDHAQAFLGIQMHMTRFSNRIAELESFLENMQLKYTSSLRECQDAVSMVHTLSHRVGVLEQERANNLKNAGISNANSLNSSMGAYRQSTIGKGYYNSMYSAPDVPKPGTSQERSLTATIEDNFRRLSSEFSETRTTSIVSNQQYAPFPEASPGSSSPPEPADDKDLSRGGSISSQANSITTGFVIDDSQYLMQQPFFSGYGSGRPSFSLQQQQQQMQRQAPKSSGSFDRSTDPIFQGSFGNDRGTGYGNDRGINYGSDRGTSFGNDRGSSFGNDRGTSFGNDRGTSFGNERGTSFGNDRGTSFGNDRGSGFGNDRASSFSNASSSSLSMGRPSFTTSFDAPSARMASKFSMPSEEATLASHNEDDEMPQGPGYFVKQMLRIDSQFSEDTSTMPPPSSFGQVPAGGDGSQSTPRAGACDSTVVTTSSGNSNSNSSSGSSASTTSSAAPTGASWLSIAKSLGLPQHSESPFMSSISDRLGTPQGSMWDHLVDEIILMVTPQDNQCSYRNSVVAFMSKQVRRTLGVHLFEIEMQGLRTFLPDDPVRMSIFVGKNEREHSWYVKLNERLCRLSGGIGGALLQDGDEASGGKLLPNEHPLLDGVPDLSEVLMPYSKTGMVPTYNHNLSNVSFLTHHDGSYKLQCLVDTSLGVEVVANFRHDLCLLMFFEEFDRLVGKNHLFKRSVLLVRAWWMYEASLSVTTNTHTFMHIPDNAIVVLLVALFNRHHDNLHFPLHALYAFLVEYSNINFSTHVFTIFGAVPYDVFADYDMTTASGIMPSVPPPSSAQALLTPEIVNKYRGLAQAKDNIDGVAGAEGERVPVSNEELAAELGGQSSRNDLSRTDKDGSGASGGSRACFPQRPVMIAHPFIASKMNMIPEPPQQPQQQSMGPSGASSGASMKRAAKIIQSIRNGAISMRKMLQAETDYTRNMANMQQSSFSGGRAFNYHDSVEQLFKTVMGRFGRGWRPDSQAPSGVQSAKQSFSAPAGTDVDGGMVAPPGLGLESPTLSTHSVSASVRSSVFEESGVQDGEEDDILTVSLDRLHDRVKYANLILESQVSATLLDLRICFYLSC